MLVQALDMGMFDNKCDADAADARTTSAKSEWIGQ